MFVLDSYIIIISKYSLEFRFLSLEFLRQALSL